MMKSLRKRHLQVWSIWTFLLPAGILLAWFSIPSRQTAELLQPASGSPLPVLVRSIDKPAYQVNLRANQQQSEWQLEWVNKRVLTYPSATIYQVTGDHTEPGKGILVGRIEARGNYYFPLRDSILNPLRLVLYDFIHDQIIDTINIK